MKIGLFFGSFNPIHIGHLVIASYMSEYTDLEKIWLVISPHNPFKEKKTLLQDLKRLQLVRIALEDNNNIKASNIEFDLPKPSYTIHTLTYLQEKFPNDEFSLIMGADNLSGFSKWKNYEMIIENHDIYVYPRAGIDLKSIEESKHPRIKITDAPIMEISSSFIREAIKNKKDIRYMLPQNVHQYIREMHYYEK